MNFRIKGKLMLWVSGTKKKSFLTQKVGRKKEFMNFRMKEKLMLWVSGTKKKNFLTQKVGRKMIFR